MGMNIENVTLRDVIIWKLTFVFTLGVMFFIPPEYNMKIFYLTLFCALICAHLGRKKVIGLNAVGKILFFLLQILVATWIFFVAHNL
jgi:hypothetical protein